MGWIAAVGVITGVATGLLGSILGVTNFWRDRDRRREDEEEKRSQFHLDACRKGYESARMLLADDNNDRATWIQAGRALKHAQALAKGVTRDEHKRLLELYRIEYRGFFFRALQKPATFFYGAKETSIPIQQAAAESTAPETGLNRTITSTLKELSPKSMFAVWEAAQWPRDYVDPLDAEFEEAQVGQLMAIFPGVHEFLDYRRNWSSASGRVRPRRQ